MKIFNTLALIFFCVLGWSQNNHCFIDSGQEMGQTVLQCENFDNYYSGYNISNVSDWSLWSSSTSSPSVSGVRSYSGSKSLKVEDSYTNPDVLYKLGDKTSGNYRLTWKMYIPSGKEGYFNMQHRESPGYWAYRVYFDSDRKGRLRVENDFYNFEYPQNRWFSVTQIIRFDSDKIELWIDGKFVEEWQFSRGDDGSYIRRLKQLGAINFYASNNDLYYVDDICFLEIDCTRVTDHISYVCVNGKEYANPTYAWCDGYTSEEWETGSCHNGGGCDYEDEFTHCTYIQCTTEYLDSHDGAFWVITAENNTDLEVAYWEVDGIRVEAEEDGGLNTYEYQAGTYTICCYLRCGERIIKCCKTVVCEPQDCEYEPQLNNCTYISCTSEYGEYEGSYWTINTNNLSSMQVEYWEINGQRQSSTSNNPTFTVYQAGTYTICCYFRCGSEIIKCCKTVVCEPETPECCSDDPLSLAWIQELTNDICNRSGDMYCNSEIWCATYNGQPAIHIPVDHQACSDGFGYVYDCNGSLLDRYGGFAGEDLEGTLQDIKKIWSNSECESCCSDDPLNLPWVQAKIDELCELESGREIWCATYEGKPVIHITPPTLYSDGSGEVFDCDGRLLGRYGFWITNPINPVNVSKIWDESECSTTCTLISEDFSGYSNGYQIANDNAWSRWSGSYSGTITAGDNLLKLDDTFEEESALLYLNESTSGIYNIKWNMFVLNNKNAGFGLYSKNSDGRYSSIKNINIVYNTYKGRWVEVNFRVDLNMNKVLVTIDGNTIVEQSISNSKNLGLLSFHTNNGYACKFYVDDVIVEEENCSGNNGWEGHLAKAKTDKDARIISKESSLQGTVEYTEEIIPEIATAEQEKVDLTITNYPNPFTERTTIAFDLTEATDAALTIYDTNGRVVHFIEQNFSGGRNEVIFENDGRLTSGMYIVSLEANGEVITHSMLMAK